MTLPALLVDDDRDVREALGQSLELAGLKPILCKSFIEATDHISPGFRGVVVTDVRMPGKDGFDLLERVLKIDKDLPVIILTGEGDVPMAVSAISKGAYDFLEKPCTPKKLISVVSRALDLRTLVLENRKLIAERTAIAKIKRDLHEDGLVVQMDAVERLLIEDALVAHQGRVARVADVLEIPRKTLYDKIKRHGLDPASYRAGQAE